MVRRRNNNDEKRKTIAEKRKLLKGADITIKNNTDADLIFEGDIILGVGESVDVSFEQMVIIAKKQKSLFIDHEAIIDDVYCIDTDEEVKPEDVELVLNLPVTDRDEEEVLDSYFFDEMLLEYEYEEFEEVIEELDIHAIFRLAERALYLYERKEFANNFKIQLIEKKLKREHLFESIDLKIK